MPESAPVDPRQRLQARAKQLGDQAQRRQQYWVDGFAAQKVDSQWAGRQERDILEMTRSGDFATSTAKPRDLKVECRSSVCRIEAGFASAADAEDWIELVTLHSGGRFTGGATSLNNLKDGSASVRILVSPR